MTNEALQPFFDLLSDAFIAGGTHALDETLLAADTLFPLVAQMEAEIAKLHSWQPIETAPKDGTDVLLYREDCGIILGKWTAPVAFLSERECEDMNEEDAFREDWFIPSMRGGAEILANSGPPTHWMPLPSSPERET